MEDRLSTLPAAVRLSVEARRQIAHDIEQAKNSGISVVDDGTLEALGLESPDGWTVRLKGVPRATDA